MIHFDVLPSAVVAFSSAEGEGAVYIDPDRVDAIQEVGTVVMLIFLRGGTAVQVHGSAEDVLYALNMKVADR